MVLMSKTTLAQTRIQSHHIYLCFEEVCEQASERIFKDENNLMPDPFSSHHKLIFRFLCESKNNEKHR